jgi:hypothetical protein
MTEQGMTMNEPDLPEPPTTGRLDTDARVQDEEWRGKQFEILRNNPPALDAFRNDPRGCAVLIDLAQHTDRDEDRNLAITWLALAYSDEPAVRTFLFDCVRREARLFSSAPLCAILAKYAGDDSAIQQLNATFRDLPPGQTADLLFLCFNYRPFLGNNKPPLGVSDEIWEDYLYSITWARARLLPNRELQDLLFDVMRRDPDGPVELVLEEILRAWPSGTPRKRAWHDKETWDRETLRRQGIEDRVAHLRNRLSSASEPDERRQILERLEKAEEYLRFQRRFFNSPPQRVQYRVQYFVEPAAELIAAWTSLAGVVRDLCEKLIALHPQWPGIEDYLREFDTVDKRRLPGWTTTRRTSDRDLQERQARIVRRMARFPDPAAVRRGFETMLFERPAIFPTGLEEEDYMLFEPVGWRRVAWHVLTTSHWTVSAAVDYARRIVELGPWDNEARKSKEALGAVVRAWPNEERVLAFVSESKLRAEIGDFVKENIGHLLGQTKG